MLVAVWRCRRRRVWGFGIMERTDRRENRNRKWDSGLAKALVAFSWGRSREE